MTTLADIRARAALDYAAVGWPVFPCWPDSKEPVGRLVPHGCKQASVDGVTIRGWWSAIPTANVAIAIGTPGPDVVDIDCKNGAPGLVTLGRLQRAGLLTGASRLVRTPSGGWHLYFAGSGQGNGSLKDHGVDFRSAGGYVVAPPSVAGCGAYELCDSREPSATVDFGRIRRYLDPPKAQPQANDEDSNRDPDDWSALVAWMARQPDGNRNNALFWAACKALGKGAPDKVLADLADAAETAGLGKHEAGRTVASARQRRAGVAR